MSDSVTGKERDRALEQRARAALDAAAAEVDPTRAARLATARRRALEAAARPTPWWRRAGPEPVGLGLAAAAGLAVALVLLRTPGEALPQPEAVEDLEILTVAEPLDLIEELDFYQWLEAEGHAAG